jgi:hypothetical protein
MPAAPRPQDQQRQPNNRLVIAVGTIMMVAVGLALVASLVNLWPAVEAGSGQSKSVTVRLLFAAVTLKLTQSTGLLVLVVLVGALGSLIHAATSFSDFVGNREFYSSWTVWYLLRLLVGLMLALLLYFAVRGGFFSGNASASSVNPYGIAALAGLAGLFSKQATDKLREVFSTLFRVAADAGDALRKDDLAHPIPVVSKLVPPQIRAGTTNLALQIVGDHFVSGTTVVKLNGVDVDPTAVTAQLVTVTVPDHLLAAPGAVAVTVFNGPPGGGESQPAAHLAVV